MAPAQAGRVVPVASTSAGCARNLLYEKGFHTIACPGLSFELHFRKRITTERHSRERERCTCLMELQDYPRASQVDLFSSWMENIEILFFMRPFFPSRLLLFSPLPATFVSCFSFCFALFPTFPNACLPFVGGGPFGPLAIRFWPIPWLWVPGAHLLAHRFARTSPAVSSKRLEDHSWPGHVLGENPCSTLVGHQHCASVGIVSSF